MMRRKRQLKGFSRALYALACAGVISCGGGDDSDGVFGAGSGATESSSSSSASSSASSSSGAGGASGTGGGSASGGGSATGGSGGAGGGAQACSPGATTACYEGPAGTQGVGLCVPGMATCKDDGSGFGPCEGQVVPGVETCTAPSDEDCDGKANEDGAGCACAPGSVAPCYSGPGGTQGVGPCKAGQQTCKADGTGFGACVGEVLPSLETCNTPGDDDCDGQTNEEGVGCVCSPGSTTTCYTGPGGTLGVGLCAAGTQQCNAAGTAYGACVGEVVPAPETCNTAGDDDCNGKANEGGAGCLCAPGSVAQCYSGPAGTQGVGLCTPGQQTCDPQGTGYGACVGEVTPGVEDCLTATDENCDGLTPPCGNNTPIIDLRADVNRNGSIDLADPTEDALEDAWTKDHGAVFLANIDDDQKTCPTVGQTDAQLAACNDAADTIINGPDDLLDLARLKTAPWPDAPADASATIAVGAPGATYVRLFKNIGGTFTVFNPAVDKITALELQSGAELAIEGKDILRDAAVWNGKVKVTLNVDAGTGPSGPLPDGSDTVELRISPVMFRHHLDPAEKVYASKINNDADSTVFRSQLSAAATAAGIVAPLNEYTTNDQWNQDYFETAYMSMPGPGGAQKVIHVNFRSANHTGSLRAAGKYVFTVLRGKDVAGAVQFDPAHPNGNDTLNSFGNLETIPPYSKNGKPLTVGRVLRGSTQTFYPDLSFDKMVNAQAVQTILYINTEWLLVGHVDETISFVKASSPRGWVMLAADPTLAVNMLQQQQQAGNGNVPMFIGMQWSGGQNAQVTITQVLNDPDVMNESAWAATQIDGQIATIKAEAALVDAEIVKIATLFEQASGYSVAYTPGMVNGIYLSDTRFGAPDPHGPSINGQDIFKAQLTSALTPYGVTVSFIEDWDLYHALDGEVHCGSNTTRVVPAATKWWESGL